MLVGGVFQTTGGLAVVVDSAYDVKRYWAAPIGRRPIQARR